MYIKNRRNSNKIKAYGLYQTLYITQSFVLRNRHKPYANRWLQAKKLTDNILTLRQYFDNNFVFET